MFNGDPDHLLAASTGESPVINPTPISEMQLSVAPLIANIGRRADWLPDIAIM